MFVTVYNDILCELEKLSKLSNIQLRDVVIRQRNKNGRDHTDGMGNYVEEILCGHNLVGGTLRNTITSLKNTCIYMMVHGAQ